MADIELAIKIPEELLSEIDDENYQSVISWYDTSLYCAIKDGIQLPKDHGKLVDVDRLKEVFKRNVVGYAGFKRLFDIAPTIIEADKKSEETE